MVRFALAALLLVIAAGPVRADAIDDARAALVAQQNGDGAEAIRLYSRAIESHELNNRYLAIAFYNRGNAYYVGRDYAAAIVDYDSATVLRPAYAQAHNNKGNAHAALAQYDDAIAAFDEAIRIAPDYALAYKNRGNAHTGAGYFDRAIVDYDRAIALAPDMAKAYNNRANAKYFLDRFAGAVADYDTALEIDPFDIYSMIWRYLATVGEGARDDGEIALLSRLRDVDSERWPAVVGRHYLGRASAEEVRATINTVDPAARAERRCEVLFYLGAGRLIEGDRDGAEKLFREALDTGVTRFVEYVGAANALERITQ